MQHIILNTETKVKEFMWFVFDNIKDIDIVAFDLETDSVEEHKANLYGIGLAFQEDEGFYIPIRNKTGELYFNEFFNQKLLSFITELLESKRIVGHNIIYDILVWFYTTGNDLTPYIHADTILMKHMVDEEPPFGLKETAVKYLGDWANKAQERLYENIELNGGSTTKTNCEMFKADTEVLGEYCAWDVMLTYKLYNKFSKILEEEGALKLFYEDEIMPLYREVTIPMKKRGVQIDIELYKQLSLESDVEIKRLESEILNDIAEDIAEFEITMLNKEFPIKKTGNFPRMYAKMVGLELESLTKKTIQSIEPSTPDQIAFKKWMSSEIEVDPSLAGQIQRALYFQKYPEEKSIFNVNSKQHLKWLLFDKYGENPLSTTEKGAPQIDDNFLDSVKDKYPWINKLRDLNTIQKMKSTYYDNILSRVDEQGILKASFLQFGTTSGRFASKNPNLQNLPAPQNTGTYLDRFVNGVRKGITARKGYKLIGADMESLEPHIAAYVSGDQGLIDIFVNNLDFYSAIAIKQFNLSGVSANKNDPNYLGVVDKSTRNLTKTYCLAAFYGADKYRISQVISDTPEKANELLQGYFKAFPGVKNFIDRTHYEARIKGFVKTIFGRTRHLQNLKKMYKLYGDKLLDSKWAKKNNLLEERKIYKNLLNNSVNFQIQGAAGHAMNRAMLKTSKLIKEHKLDAHILMTIHDEQIIEVREDQVEKALPLIREAMSTAVDLYPIKLKSNPVVGNNYGECK